MPAESVVIKHPGSYTPGYKQCWRDKKKGRDECSYQHGSWTPPSDEVVDANDDARNAYVEDCMYRRGYLKK